MEEEGEEEEDGQIGPDPRYGHGRRHGPRIRREEKRARSGDGNLAWLAHREARTARIGG